HSVVEFAVGWAAINERDRSPGGAKRNPGAAHPGLRCAPSGLRVESADLLQSVGWAKARCTARSRHDAAGTRRAHACGLAEKRPRGHGAPESRHVLMTRRNARLCPPYGATAWPVC